MSALCGGITICLAEKFSVKNFWTDIRDSRATVFIYVGETARCMSRDSSYDVLRLKRLQTSLQTRPVPWIKLTTSK